MVRARELDLPLLQADLTNSITIICFVQIVDEGMRIARDIDDNFFVFTRA